MSPNKPDGITLEKMSMVSRNNQAVVVIDSSENSDDSFLSQFISDAEYVGLPVLALRHEGKAHNLPDNVHEFIVESIDFIDAST